MVSLCVRSIFSHPTLVGHTCALPGRWIKFHERTRPTWQLPFVPCGSFSFGCRNESALLALAFKYQLLWFYHECDMRCDDNRNDATCDTIQIHICITNKWQSKFICMPTTDWLSLRTTATQIVMETSTWKFIRKYFGWNWINNFIICSHIFNPASHSPSSSNTFLLISLLLFMLIRDFVAEYFSLGRAISCNATTTSGSL